jgi:hypothetical protein
MHRGKGIIAWKYGEMSCIPGQKNQEKIKIKNRLAFPKE